jgi:peptidoglycan/LPS O-acetylase OafA/YrhL
LDNRYPALHGLRVLAILSIVQYHVTMLLWHDGRIPMDPDFALGSMSIFFGMDLFFVLSGFLIGTILIHAFEGAGAKKIRRFYLRRAFRTFPSYYVVLAFLALTTALTPAQQAHLPYEAGYLTNFLHSDREGFVMPWGWSLALEEQFYLAVPLLFFALYKLRSDRAKVGLLVALWLSALVVRVAIFVRGSPWDEGDLMRALYFRTYTRFDTLVCGILLALLHHRYKAQIASFLEPPHRRAAVAIGCLACAWVLVRPYMFGVGVAPVVKMLSWGTLTTVMYFGVLSLLLHAGGPITRALSAPFFRSVATLGYGVYLVHIPLCDHVVVPVARVLHGRGVPWGVMWVGALVALVLLSHGLAYVMHVVIEKPSLWVRDRVAA